MTLLFQVLAVGLGIMFCALLACAVWAGIKFRGAQRRRSLLRVSLAFGVWVLAAAAHYVLLFFVFLPRLGHDDRTAHSGTLVRSGQHAPEFQLATVEGTSVGPEQLRGHVVVINFFATWCGPCLTEMAQLQNIWTEYKANSSFALICVARQESDEIINQFRSKHGFTLPMAPDPTGSVYSQFATDFIPRTYLLARDGTVRYEWTGNYPHEMAKLKTLIRKELDSHE